MEKKKIEKAAFIHEISGPCPAGLEKFSVVCVGSEFCPLLLPSASQLSFLHSDRARTVVLYTSFFTGAGLSSAKKKISSILSIFPKIEIMLNDLGLLAWLNSKYPNVRKGVARPLSVEFMRMAYGPLLSFMKKNRLSSIETDEANMTLNFPPSRPFKIYFRSGLKFAAMSRYCAHTRKLSSSCCKECSGKFDSLSVPGSDSKLISFKNAYFTEGENTKRVNCERIVYDFPGERR